MVPRPRLSKGITPLPLCKPQPPLSPPPLSPPQRPKLAADSVHQPKLQSAPVPQVPARRVDPSLNPAPQVSHARDNFDPCAQVVPSALFAPGSAFEKLLNTLTERLTKSDADPRSGQKRLCSEQDFPLLFENCVLQGITYECYARNPELMELKERTFKQNSFVTKDEQTKHYVSSMARKALVMTSLSPSLDNCSDTLTPARFLRGPVRSPGEMFAEAAATLSTLEPDPTLPISEYSIADFGFAHTLSPSTWKNLHNIGNDQFTMEELLAVRTINKKKPAARDVTTDEFLWGMTLFSALNQTIFPWDRSHSILAMWIQTKRLQLSEKYRYSPLPSTGEALCVIFNAWCRERANRFLAKMPCPSASDITSLWTNICASNPRLVSRSASDRLSDGRVDPKTPPSSKKSDYLYSAEVWGKLMRLCGPKGCCASWNSNARECGRPLNKAGDGCKTATGSFKHLCPRCDAPHRFAVEHEKDMPKKSR